MKTKLLTLLLIAFTSISYSQTFTVDGLNFEVISESPNEVQITGGSVTSNLVIPESVENDGIAYSVVAITFRAFRQKRTITTLTIPESMRSLGNEAFQSNPIIEVTVLGAIPPTIVKGTFSNRENIDLTVPSESEGAYIAANWTGFLTVNDAIGIGLSFNFEGLSYEVTSANPNEVALIDGNETTGSLTINETVSFNEFVLSVTSIAEDAFNGNLLTDVTIPNGIFKIEDEAFRNNSLTSIIIPNSVTGIGTSAFANNELATIILGNSVESIGNSAFSNNEDLVLVTSNNTTPPVLENNAFAQTANLKSLRVPIGNETAYRDGGWTDFTEVNETFIIGESFTVNDVSFSVTSSNPFNLEVTGASGTDILIPNTLTILGFEFSVTSIAAGIFEDNTAITSINLGENIKSIGFGAFRDSGIVEVISNATTPPVLEDSVFRDTGIKKLTVPVGKEAAYAEAGWTQFLVVNDTFVEGKTFSVDGFDYEISSEENTADLTSATGQDVLVPGAVFIIGLEIIITGIGNEIFRSSTRNTVVLGENIERLGDGAFRRSTINRITSKNTTPPVLGNLAFADRSRGNIGAIVVPVGTIDTYAAAGWPADILVEESNSITLNLKAFLQGAYINPNNAEEDLMRDDLREAELFPNNSPYEDARPRNDSIAFLSAGENAMVDWVLVELIDANDLTTVFDSRSLIILRNGEIKDHHIVDLEIFNPVFDTPTVQNYFIRIQHRNHVSIQASNTISSDQSFVNLDFTNDPTLAEGGENALVEVSEGVFAMIAGDFNENGQVQPSDVNETTAAIGTSSYSNADMDMNGQIQPADVNNLVNPNVGRGVQF